MTRPSSAIVTGASGALAAAVIAELDRSGWRTALVDRGPSDRLAQRAAQRPARSVDLLDEAATRQALHALDDELGGADVLLHLAGGFAMTPAVELDLAALRRQLDVNLLTLANAVNALLPRMAERGRGTLVGIAAGQAVDGGAKAAPYAAAKAASVAYLRSIDKELAARGVRTLVVYPLGTLDTPANREAMPAADPAGWIDTGALAQAIVQTLSLGPRARLSELRVGPDPR